MRALPTDGGHPAELHAFAGLVLALLALAFGGVVRSLRPEPDSPPICDPAPPIVVSLPAELPAAPEPTPQAQQTTASPVPASSPRPSPTPVVRVRVSSLLRADDPPADHGLSITSGPIMPLVVPPPCVISADARRARSVPCVALAAPGGRLCASGAVGEGRLFTEGASSSFVLQADRVTLRDTGGASVVDEVQGFVRYDDPDRGLLLMCPHISYLEPVSSNALRLVALCSNYGADGWAISGQVTDGGTAAPDSASFAVDAPDGSQITLVGSVARGAILVRAAE